jgi:hypothetical protein
VQPVQRSGQTVRALLQELARDQTDVPTHADLDLIDFVGERPIRVPTLARPFVFIARPPS